MLGGSLARQDADERQNPLFFRHLLDMHATTIMRFQQTEVETNAWLWLDIVEQRRGCTHDDNEQETDTAKCSLALNSASLYGYRTSVTCGIMPPSDGANKDASPARSPESRPDPRYAIENPEIRGGL